VAFDLYVCGATPGGFATAIRAARLGMRVLLSHHLHVPGGMFASGMGLMDAFYDGGRSPFYHEFVDALVAHYAQTYGVGSAQHRAALPGPRLVTHQTGAFEPHVAQMIFEKMLAAEKNVRVVYRHQPTAVQRSGRRITGVTLTACDGVRAVMEVTAATYVDATYEGDLMALAGAAYTVGREGREVYGEPHAGRLFARKELRWRETVIDGEKVHEAMSPRAAVDGTLNLRTWHHPTVEVLPATTGEGDTAVQSYNYRFCLTRDPANRIIIDRPANYDRTLYAHLPANAQIGMIAIINDKGSWNLARPIGWNSAYPDGDEATRAAIRKRYLDYALGMMFYLQNDAAIDAATREKNRMWGLPRDEFADNGHVPHELYARETRRLVGRHVFTEHDGLPVKTDGRTLIHADSIASTDWPMDSVQCRDEYVEHAGERVVEGAFFLSEESRPAMVPYRCLVPREIDNLLVTFCVSASHVGWGALRLEPVAMHVGEAAAYAAAQALAAKQDVAAIDVQHLQETLAQARVLLAWFSDMDVREVGAWGPALQLLAVRGLFDSYHARAGDSLDEATAKLWADRLGLPLSSWPAEIRGRLGQISRGEACAILWNIVKAKELAAHG